MQFPKPKKTASTSTQMHKLDRIFSEYIRVRDANSNGYCVCISCGRVDHYKLMDAGHFISRDKKATRFDARNVHAQCRNCNRFRSGEQFAHGLSIDKKYGSGTAQLLRNISMMKTKLTPMWFEEHLIGYKTLLKDVKRKLIGGTP